MILYWLFTKDMVKMLIDSFDSYPYYEAEQKLTNEKLKSINKKNIKEN